MAKKSKTQRAKASARRAAKKEARKQALQTEQTEKPAEQETSKKSSSLSKRKSNQASKASQTKAASQSKKKEKEQKQPGRISTFFSGVRTEMKRVTWPSRSAILRWSGVVAGTLIFFSLFVFVIDNWIATPILLAISSIGA